MTAPQLPNYPVTQLPDHPLQKSKRSAVIIGLLTALVFAITSAALNMLIPYWISGDIHAVIAQPETFTDPAQILALVIIVLLVFLGLGAIGAYWIYRFFGEAYFGVRGLWRWMLFGLLFALLSQFAIWFFPDNAILEWTWPLVSLIGAFFAARWMIKIEKPGF